MRATIRHRNQEEVSRGSARPCVKLSDFPGCASLCSENDDSAMRCEALLNVASIYVSAISTVSGRDLDAPFRESEHHRCEADSLTE